MTKHVLIKFAKIAQLVPDLTELVRSGGECLALVFE